VDAVPGAALGGDDGGTQRHAVLGVGVDGDRPPQLGAHQLGDQRDAGRAPDQQHPGDVLGRDVGRAQGPAERTDRVDQRGPDHGLELGPGEPHVGLDVGQHHRDHDVDVAGQRLLGLDAVAPEPGERRHGGRVVGVERLDGLAHRRLDVVEHGLVEVDAAQALDALGLAEDLPPRGVATEDGGVERAPAQVVDGDDGARLHPLLGGVVDGGRLGLGDRGGVAQVGEAEGLPQEVLLERAPVGGVRHDDPVRRLTLPFGHGVDDRAQQPGGQRVGRVGRAADDDRRGIAHPPLELAGHPQRFGDRPPLGGLPGEDRAVVAQQHHRRHHRRPGAQVGDLDPPVSPHRRRGVGGPEVDPQVVAHFSPALSRSGQIRSLAPAVTDHRRHDPATR
jgi:hypothetical protein